MILENKTIQKFINSCYKKLFKIEVVALILIVTGILMQYIKPEISEFIISFAFVTISVIYYFLAFRSFEKKTKWDDFYLKLNYFSLSIACIGILFTLNRWAGNETVITASLISLVLAILAGSLEITFLNKGNLFHKSDVLRLVVALFIVVVLIFISPIKIFNSEREDYRKEFNQSETQEAIP